jgi:delta 1-pyrroline-5-carboxylate dehydrogenase
VGTIESFKALILEEGDNASFINHITLTCLEFLYGDPENAVRVFESIPAHVLTQLKQAYEDEAARAKGWQLDWCLQVLRAISDVSRKS